MVYINQSYHMLFLSSCNNSVFTSTGLILKICLRSSLQKQSMKSDTSQMKSSGIYHTCLIFTVVFSTVVTSSSSPIAGGRKLSFVIVVMQGPLSSSVSAGLVGIQSSYIDGMLTMINTATKTTILGILAKPYLTWILQDLFDTPEHEKKNLIPP